MAEKPTDDLESSAARLAAEVQEAAGKNKGKAPTDAKRHIAAASIFGVAAIAVSAVFLSGGEETAKMPETAQPDAFQTEAGPAFGNLTLPTPERIVEKDVAESEALKAQLAAVQAELERLKNAPAPDDLETAEPDHDPALVSTIAAMEEKLEALTKRLESEAASRADALAEKDRELARLQAALDTAELGGGDSFEPLVSGDATSGTRDRRTRSPMIAFGGSSNGASDDAGKGSSVDGSGVGRTMSTNELFAREGAGATKVERANVIANPANTILQGTMIQAVLETFINSDLPGQIRAVVGEDVHSYDGTHVLIPRGSKVIGQYSDQVELGQRRAMVVWTRIIMPDAQTISLAAIGGDAIGQSGLAGRVNTHFGSRFGAAMLVSILGIGPSLAVGDNSSENAQDVTQSVSRNLSTATSTSLSGALNRQPTIIIQQGARVTIMVDRDLEIF